MLWVSSNPVARPPPASGRRRSDINPADAAPRPAGTVRPCFFARSVARTEWSWRGAASGGHANAPGEGRQLMTWSSRGHHALVAASAKLFVAGALIYAGVVAGPAMAVGYPAPGGIYAPFTDCPLHKPEMRLADPGFAMGCIKSITPSGTFTINGIPVAITHPVTVQFGTYSVIDSTGSQVFFVVPPQDHKQLLAEPEIIPDGLLVLVCSTGDPAVAKLCQKAMKTGKTDLAVEVQLAGPITNFSPLAEVPFTLPIKVKLTNPLLGGKCFIGSDDDPILLNPTFNPVGTLKFASA